MGGGGGGGGGNINMNPYRGGYMISKRGGTGQTRYEKWSGWGGVGEGLYLAGKGEEPYMKGGGGGSYIHVYYI